LLNLNRFYTGIIVDRLNIVNPLVAHIDIIELVQLQKPPVDMLQVKIKLFLAVSISYNLYKGVECIKKCTRIPCLFRLRAICTSPYYKKQQNCCNRPVFLSIVISSGKLSTYETLPHLWRGSV
jgi:hypothetical protein